MTPWISIITPTIQRESLIRACESVDIQLFKSWQHIVALDVAIVNEDMFKKISHPQRFVYQCDYPHRNYGNSCRHRAWEFATGEYLLYLDCDNFLDGNRVLEEIHSALTSPLFDPPDWAIFPIMRFGSKFFNDPPGLCMTDTLNVVVKREIGRWPDIPDYTADGHWVEGLKKYPYRAFPNFRPIGVMQTQGKGQ